MKPLERRLVRESRAARVHLLVTVAAGVASAATVIAGAALLAHIIVRAFLDGAPLAELMPFLIALALVALARGALAWVSEWSAARGARMRRAPGAKICEASLPFMPPCQSSTIS